MPDRDQFAHVPKGLKRVVDTICGACLGNASTDLLLIAEAVTKLLAGGVTTLRSVLKVVDSLDSRNQRLLPLGVEEPLDRIAEIRLTQGRSAADLVLEQAASTVILEGRADRQSVAREFVEVLVNHSLVDSTGGVCDRLKRALTAEEHDRLAAALSPVVEAAAREIAEKPGFRRPRFSSEFKTPLDANTNILRGLDQ
jgi:hypothetical protein